MERLEESGALRGGGPVPRARLRVDQHLYRSGESENKFSGVGKVRRNHAYTVQVLALCLV